MTKTKSICAVALAVLMAASVMAGCKNSGGTSSTSSNQVVTIKTTYGTGEFTADLLKQFEKTHPNIKINEMSADTAKIMAMIAAGNGPDFIRAMGVQDIPTYVIRGIALNLDKYFASSKLIKTSDMLNVCYTFKYDPTTLTQGKGHWYGLPKDWSSDYGLWINKQMFTDAGIAIPDDTKRITYDTLAQWAKKLTKTDASGNVTQYGFQTLNGSPYSYDLALYYAMLQNSETTSKDFLKAEYSNQANTNAINWTMDMCKAKAMPSPLSVAPDGGNVLFVNQQLAIYQAGYWYSGALRGYDGTMVGAQKTKMNLDNYMYLPAPQWTDGTNFAPCSSACGGIIWRGTKHPDQAFTVLEWFFAGAAADDRAKGGWGIPAWKSKMAEMPDKSNFDKQCLTVNQNELKYVDPFITYSPYLQPTAVNSIFDKYLSPVYFGKDTVAHATSQIDTDINTLAQEGKEIAGK